jgi:predicted kinase
MKTFSEFLEEGRLKQLTIGPSRSRIGLDRQRKDASERAAFRRAGMRRTQSGGQRQRFNSTQNQNEYSKTAITSYPSQSAYARDSLPEKERHGGDGEGVRSTQDRALHLRRLKKQLRTTRTRRGVHVVDILPRGDYKKNDPKDLPSRGREFHRVVGEVPQEIINAGGKKGDKIVGKASEVMPGSKNPEKGRMKRRKLYSKVIGATKWDPITKVQVASVKEEMKTFSEFIAEANRRAQRASKAGRKPKEGEKSTSTEKPTAVVTVGLPGSGKSTIAKHMVSKGNTDQHELDKSRKALGKGPAHFGQDIVHHTYSGAKKSAEQGRSTVLSNTSIPKQHRQDAIDKLKDSGYKNVKAVLSPGSTKAAMRRNRKRTGTNPGEGAVPQFVMNRMKQGMDSMSRSDKRELRANYKKLHKKERFTKPAMKRSGVIK